VSGLTKILHVRGPSSQLVGRRKGKKGLKRVRGILVTERERTKVRCLAWGSAKEGRGPTAVMKSRTPT